MVRKIDLSIQAKNRLKHDMISKESKRKTFELNHIKFDNQYVSLVTLTAISFIRAVTTILYSVTNKQRINVLRVITSEYDVTSRRFCVIPYLQPIYSAYDLLLNVNIKNIT